MVSSLWIDSFLSIFNICKDVIFNSIQYIIFELLLDLLCFFLLFLQLRFLFVFRYFLHFVWQLDRIEWLIIIFVLFFDCCSKKFTWFFRFSILGCCKGWPSAVFCRWNISKWHSGFIVTQSKVISGWLWSCWLFTKVLHSFWTLIHGDRPGHCQASLLIHFELHFKLLLHL